MSTIKPVIHSIIRPVIYVGETVAGGGGGGAYALPTAVDNIYNTLDGAAYRYNWASMYQDIAGTQEVTAAGQTVGKVKDLQTKQTNKPLVASSDPVRANSVLTSGGREAAGVAGSSSKSLRWSGGASLNKTSPITVMYLVDYSSIPATSMADFTIANISNTAKGQVGYYNSSTKFFMYATAIVNGTTTPVADTNYKVRALIQSAGNKGLEIDEVVETTGNPGDVSDGDVVHVFQHNGFGSYGRFMAHCWFDGEPSSGQIANVHSWFDDIIAGTD